ncbi:type II secretion system F family protein [Clostridium sp. MSJ-8]|uniref:type II secretion system F family protein n=1 Tax=Clostridium sp. MSJ-8 TaxID=2841510 RepID=UPI001C0EA1DC|nr:type II secretion system F family protein [Clostridium sp. MSJ-8]MBU5487547.1 type II secretion system F family protein [Clostridium sp. MSJ-8]
MRKQSENLIMISEALGNLYNEGISIESSLLLLSELDLNKEYKRIILLVHREVLKGMTLSEAFKRYPKFFPTMFSGFVKIGEDNGSLSRVLWALKDYYSIKQNIETKIKAAIAYPCIVLSTLLLMAIVIFIIFLPKMCNMLLELDRDFTGSIKNLYNYRVELDNNPLLFWGRIISSMVICIIIITILKDNIDYKNKMKKFKIIRLYYENILLLILSIIYKSQGNIVQGLCLAKESMDNNIVQRYLEYIYEKLIQGNELSYTLENIDILSKHSLSFIKIGEKGGDVEEMITKALNSNNKELIKCIDKKLKLIEPGLMILLAVIVCFILIKCIVPFMNSLNG